MGLESPISPLLGLWKGKNGIFHPVGWPVATSFASLIPKLAPRNTGQGHQLRYNLRMFLRDLLPLRDILTKVVQGRLRSCYIIPMGEDLSLEWEVELPVSGWPGTQLGPKREVLRRHGRSKLTAPKRTMKVSGVPF